MAKSFSLLETRYVVPLFDMVRLCGDSNVFFVALQSHGRSVAAMLGGISICFPQVL